MKLPSALTTYTIIQQMTERSLAAFFIYNLQSQHFDYVNPAFEEIWETSAEEINENIPALLNTIAEEDLPSLQKSYGLLLSTALRQSLECRILLQNDKTKWISLTAYCILEEGKRNLIAGLAEDITHFKENEILANKIGAHKNAMLEMLSHDLGGPLGIALQLIIQFQQYSKQKDEKILEERSGLIRKTLEKSIHLINSYLEVEYLESVKTPLKIQRAELIEQLEVLLNGYKRMDPEKHKNFHLHFSSPQIYVNIDLTKFIQAINNLVSNSIKFTKNNGNITIQVQEQGQSLLISVNDDGVGIPAKLQPLLFERFTKARRPGLRGEETVGLGLSIVKRIVEMHQGKIWMESEENKGATFFIEIPYTS